MSSKYFNSLSASDKERYLSKLRIDDITLPDPLSSESECLFNSTSVWPKVSYPDICNYLINTPGRFTHENLKAYKSLDAYNYFVSSRVRKLCSYHQESKKVCLVLGHVEPGQRSVKSQNDLYKAWILAEMDGAVMYGHCTCMAGLGEVCSHVGAILFAVMATVEAVGNDSRTSKPCAWLAVKKKATTAPICEIDFTKIKYGSSSVDGRDVTTVVPSSTDESTSPHKPHKELFSIIKNTAANSTLSTMLPRNESSTDTASENEADTFISPFLDRLFFKGRFGPIFYTSAERDLIEKNTRGQSSTKEWFEHRRGRITGSILHKVLHMKESTDKGTIVHEILNGTPELRVASVAWRKKNEKSAIKAALALLKQEHTNVKFTECGFFISEEDSFFGASPDGIMTCDCYGEHCMEIKCPFSLKEVDLNDPNFKPPSSFSIKNNMLIPTHSYYTQVQAQMAATQIGHSYFCVWTLKSVKIVEVGFCPEFWISAREDMRTFYKLHVVPALTNKFKRALKFD